MKDLSVHSILKPSNYSRSFQDDPPDRAAQIQAVIPGYSQLPFDMIDEDALLFHERLPLNPTRRLVVLIPSGEINETAFARRIWQIAASSNLTILYLALSPDSTRMAYERRRLASLAALTSGLNVRAHASVSSESTWQKALGPVMQGGDLLVCLDTHMVPKNLFWHTPLGKQLAGMMNVPVYLIGGFVIAATPQERSAIREALAWMVSLALIAAFFALQVRIDRSIDGLFATLLLCLSAMAEVYLIWKFNEWIG